MVLTKISHQLQIHSQLKDYGKECYQNKSCKRVSFYVYRHQSKLYLKIYSHSILFLILASEIKTTLGELIAELSFLLITLSSSQFRTTVNYIDKGHPSGNIFYNVHWR